jgi:Uncharacterized protein family, UPF0114
VFAEIWHITDMTRDSVILMALSLIDLSLAGNLLLIVIFSGYERPCCMDQPGGRSNHGPTQCHAMRT